ncbi:DNA primase small subunit [Ditylenchus destructor]|uniref:DNA primase small subunit n=1 Tax=Ditylenchus destructor TaxID=166010 RepID=A0AAD4NKC8_9BILA|nr:DNA primase small subunit [Ditylenchus destructor]
MELDKNNADCYLKDYYRSLYPVDRITKWLSYGKDPSEYFARREFAFILEARIAVTSDKTSSVITKSRVHPMAEHSYRTIMDCCDIDKLILEQKWLDSEESWDPILKLCEDSQMRDTLHSEFLEISLEYVEASL